MATSGEAQTNPNRAANAVGDSPNSAASGFLSAVISGAFSTP